MAGGYRDAAKIAGIGPPERVICEYPEMRWYPPLFWLLIGLGVLQLAAAGLLVPTGHRIVPWVSLGVRGAGILGPFVIGGLLVLGAFVLAPSYRIQVFVTTSRYICVRQRHSLFSHLIDCRDLHLDEIAGARQTVVRSLFGKLQWVRLFLENGDELDFLGGVPVPGWWVVARKVLLLLCSPVLLPLALLVVVVGVLAGPRRLEFSDLGEHMYSAVLKAKSGVRSDMDAGGR